MCGIYSILNWRHDGNTQNEFMQQEFMKGKSRGPDHSVWMNKSPDILLGFHRLAINGLNPTSNQPIISHDGKIMLICNGQIYNWRELEEQNNWVYKTQSDCEAIIHCYIKCGIRYTLNILDGVYSFILYDFRGDIPVMHVARDPYRIRPLFKFSGTNMTSGMYSFFGFASLMKMVDTTNNDVVISSISQFHPGTYETYKYIANTDDTYGGSWIFYGKDRYYSLYSLGSIQNELSIVQHNIRKYLMNAVEKRVRNTDRKIACLLSGGLDSSLIAALVQYISKTRIDTYSIGMKGSPDLMYAKKVANYIGSNHHEVIIDDDICKEYLKTVIYEIESYDTTTVRASIGNYLVAKYISENSDAKVIFNGDGSDELCGGYLYMHMAPDNDTFDMECKRLLKDIHKYDVLRSDRSISSNGLEARTPFLDKQFVNMYLQIPIELRTIGMKMSGVKTNNNIKNTCIEKWLLRSSFESMKILPEDVLWRKKEAFSDGIIQENTTLWYKDLEKQFKVQNKKGSETFENSVYREIYYSNYGMNTLQYYWMPKFIKNAKDASARTLNIYHE